MVLLNKVRPLPIFFPILLAVFPLLFSFASTPASESLCTFVLIFIWCSGEAERWGSGERKGDTSSPQPR